MYEKAIEGRRDSHCSLEGTLAVLGTRATNGEATAIDIVELGFEWSCWCAGLFVDGVLSRP